MANFNHIKVENLWKVFGRDPLRVFESNHINKTRDEIQSDLGLVVALKNVSFEVAKGETFVIMGLSGSGKSTLVRCLIRLIESTSGDIFIDEENINTFDQSQLIDFRRSKAAMVFQNFGLLPHRNVIDNTAYGLEVKNVDKDKRYETSLQMLKLVGLEGWEHSRVRQLSGGMQQRVGLARALSVEPEILLMDEPFSGLDPLIRRQMRRELTQLQNEIHKTIVFITHDLDEAIAIGDRIVIMRDGEIIQHGTPEEIITAPADEFVREFTDDIPKAKFVKVGTIFQEIEFKSYKIQDLIPADINALYKKSSLEEAVNLIVSSEGSLPVIDENRRLLGVISQLDVLNAMSEYV